MDVELKEVATADEAAAQERRLVQGLAPLGENLPCVTKAMDDLAKGLGSPLDPAVAEALERLSALASANDSAAFYAAAQHHYVSPEEMAADVDLWHRLRDLAQLAPEVLELKSYLEGMASSEEGDDLALDRMSLLGQLSLSALAGTPRLWASIRALFDWLKARYGAAYRAHHHEYHGQLASLRRRLQEGAAQVRALELLNGIVELGAPLGEELPRRHQELLARSRPCVEVSQASLEAEPRCPLCGLSLGDEPPTQEAERLLEELHDALGEQQRRLGSEAVRQILAQSGESRVDRFVKVVQASDLTSLANVLNDDLVAFLRQLLARAP